MSKKRLTISDIASHCGVSKTTVSFILNNKGEEKRISADVTKKVLDYIEETNYKPNQLATSFRTGITRTIGLIVENISDSFFSLVAGEIEKIAIQENYKIIFSSTFNNVDRAKEIITMFKHQHVDGLIITPTLGLEDEIIQLQKDKKPFVLFDRYFKNISTNNVVLNNKMAAYEGCQHLIENNYKNIAFVTIDSKQNQMEERLDGYLSAIKDAGLKPKVLIVNFEESIDNTITKIKNFIEKEKECDALFFSTNYLTIKGLSAINQLNKKILEDYGVLTFDDHEIFQMQIPAITAMQQPIHEMCVHLMNNLLQQMDNKSDATAINHTVVPAKLIIRNSTSKK